MYALYKPSIYLLLAFLGFYCAAAFADEIDDLLKQEQAPNGVVFEIVSDEDDLLERMLPVVRGHINRLRARFPGLDIAIVSHGKEQFALTSSSTKDEQATHSLVKDLVQKDEIAFHVCGTHAGWYGVTPEEFPKYVDVSTAAPAQINDYEQIGYEVIVLTD